MNALWPVVQTGAMSASASGARFRLISGPSRREVRGCVVLAPAFAEEMNKARRMTARMARMLAAEGWRVAQVDLYGCGDSDGEFRDASWAAWTTDLDNELQACDSRLPVWLWCMRAGALLAPSLLASRPQLNLLLWQPVLSGALHLQQFLRLHAGSRIVGSGAAADAPAPSTLLRAGHTVELGGYELSPALAASLEQAKFDVPHSFRGRIVWLEVGAQEPPQASLPSMQAIARMRERGVAVELDVLQGPAFWQTQEIEECEPLLMRTLARLGGVPAGHAGAVQERAGG